MAKQEIREFGDFTGENNQGYIIVGGKTADIEGGKKLLSDIVPNIPTADEETITNDNGTLKVKEPVPPHEGHNNSFLCVDDWDGEVKWTDDLDDKITVDDVWNTICVAEDLENNANYGYPLRMNASGGIELQTNNDTQVGAVLTVMPDDSEHSFDWVLPPEQVQADWEQDDDTKKDYIKNKPTVENGAQVNKIEGIVIQKPHIAGDVLPINNKLVTLDFGSGALVDNNGNLDFYCTAPLCNGEGSNGGASLAYDDTLTLKDNALSVAVPVPATKEVEQDSLLAYTTGLGTEWAKLDNYTITNETGTIKANINGTGGLVVDGGICVGILDNAGLNRTFDAIYIGADDTIEFKKGPYNVNQIAVAVPVPDPEEGNHDGHILTYDSSEGIVWAEPQSIVLPEYTQADAGKVLAVKADGTGLEWISLVPANAVGVNNEPVGVNGDYFTVGE